MNKIEDARLASVAGDVAKAARGDTRFIALPWSIQSSKARGSLESFYFEGWTTSGSVLSIFVRRFPTSVEAVGAFSQLLYSDAIASAVEEIGWIGDTSYLLVSTPSNGIFTVVSAHVLEGEYYFKVTASRSDQEGLGDRREPLIREYKQKLQAFSRRIHAYFR